MADRVTFNSSNKSQQYATHGYFRYFGKLPPVVNKHILEKGLTKGGPFLDLMSGSGTGLIEANFLGIDSTGVEVNPLSVLISKVKTTKIAPDVLVKTLKTLMNDIVIDINKVPINSPFDNSLPYINEGRPNIRNKSYWFTDMNEVKLIVLLHHINKLEEEDVKDFFKLAFFSIIRRASNASIRTGRIFKETELKDFDLNVYQKKVESMIEGMEEFIKMKTNAKITILQEDARKTSLSDESFGFILNHPPYFALYKYSSDVLRFELEWGRFDRSLISKTEIRDGFKTTDIKMFDKYLEDMTELFIEAYRLLKKGHLFCVVVNDSTLREVQLPVIQEFIKSAEKIGFKLSEHNVRDVMFSQARYHMTSNPYAQHKEDHILFFLK